MKMRQLLLLLIFVFAVWLPGHSHGGVPEVSHIMVTDVTAVSFSVIWAASESSAADLRVYADEAGITQIADAVILPHPVTSEDDSIRIAAEDSGVMKVMVTGLSPNTTYYFQTVTTSKESSDTTYDPVSAPFSEVTTEVRTVRTYEDGADTLPFSNDVIIEPCYLEDGITPAIGSLLIATVAGGNHPISTFVGDGVESPYALIDLNNMFSRETFENLDLVVGKNLTFLNFGGINGNSIVTQKVPNDLNLAELKNAELGLYSGRNMVSFQLEPDYPDIFEILSPILDKIVSAWAYDTEQNEWQFFIKDGLPFLNNLNSIYAYTGFYLYVTEPDSLKVFGTFGSSSISLTSGRNLVGYHSIETVPVIDAFESIYNDLISVWHFDVESNQWRFFVKDGLPFLNTLQQIEPGKSYWVYVYNDCIW